jgi:hypothetical protein
MTDLLQKCLIKYISNKVLLSLRNTSLHEDIAHAYTRPILNLNWKIVKSYSILSQLIVIVIFKSIILKPLNQSFFFTGT